MHEQLAIPEKAEDPLTPKEREERRRFHARLTVARKMNKDLAEKQRQLRLQGKPSKGTVHKSWYNALRITVLLNMMLEMRGLRLYYRPWTVCQCCGLTKHASRVRPIHAIRKEDKNRAETIRREIRTLLAFYETLESDK